MQTADKKSHAISCQMKAWCGFDVLDQAGHRERGWAHVPQLKGCIANDMTAPHMGSFSLCN